MSFRVGRSHLTRIERVILCLLAIGAVVVVLSPSSYEPGNLYLVGRWGEELGINNTDLIPEAVVAAAYQSAGEFFSDSFEKAQALACDMLGSYQLAADSDVVIIFNSGGWGWSSVSESFGWMGILEGIEDCLMEFGYSVISFDYKRTSESLAGCVGEISDGAGLSSLKSEELAMRVTFLTSEIPGLRVIIAGESNGAALCEKSRYFLGENPDVCYIETGPPFWYPATSSERVLVVNDNGRHPDTFSSGNIFAIIGANLESFFGLSRSDSGKILGYIGAPGHAYSWEYEGVRSQIVNFLHDSFAQDSGGL